MTQSIEQLIASADSLLSEDDDDDRFIKPEEDFSRASDRLLSIQIGLGKIIPEMHALITSTSPLHEERQNLVILFNELNYAHTDLGNFTSMASERPDDPQWEAIAETYTRMLSDISLALSPYKTQLAYTPIGPYQLSDSVDKHQGDPMRQLALVHGYSHVGSEPLSPVRTHPGIPFSRETHIYRKGPHVLKIDSSQFWSHQQKGKTYNGPSTNGTTYDSLVKHLGKFHDRLGTESV